MLPLTIASFINSFQQRREYLSLHGQPLLLTSFLFWNGSYYMFSSSSYVLTLSVTFSGRVARAGKSGKSYSLISADELPYLADLFLFLGRPLNFAKPDSIYRGCTLFIFYDLLVIIYRLELASSSPFIIRRRCWIMLICFSHSFTYIGNSSEWNEYKL